MVRSLCFSLGDPCQAVRNEALIALGILIKEVPLDSRFSVRTDLLQLLRHPKPPPRAAALEAMSMLVRDVPIQLPKVLAAIDDESPLVARNVCKLLEIIANPEVAAKRSRWAQDSEEEENPEEIVEAISGAMYADASEVRVAATRALAAYPSCVEERHIEDVRDALIDRAYLVREAACDTLSSIFQSDVPAAAGCVKAIIQRLDDASWKVRCAALNALGTMAKHEDAGEVVPVIIAILRSAEEPLLVKQAAVKALHSMSFNELAEAEVAAWEADGQYAQTAAFAPIQTSKEEDEVTDLMGDPEAEDETTSDHLKQRMAQARLSSIGTALFKLNKVYKKGMQEIGTSKAMPAKDDPQDEGTPCEDSNSGGEEAETHSAAAEAELSAEAEAEAAAEAEIDEVEAVAEMEEAQPSEQQNIDADERDSIGNSDEQALDAN